MAERRRRAVKKIEKLRKKGRSFDPVEIEGRAIAKTFWGKAWCEHIESYSDFSNRLPRGRTYVRNGSVLDLQISASKVSALVSGSELYTVNIDIKQLPGEVWKAIKSECSGKIDSVIELLQGKLSDGVMQVITHREKGLFPSPKEIQLKCSCPDGAYMCKHLAATLYGVAARLDHKPELLFKLRQVDHEELIAEADVLQTAGVSREASAGAPVAAAELSNLFGIELEEEKPDAPSVAASRPAPKRPKRKAKRATKRKARKGTGKRAAPGRNTGKKPKEA
jgi:uncharacterized Zn finger protein